MQKQIHDNSINRDRSCALSHGTWRRVGAKLACAGACALMAGQLLLPSVALAAEWVNVGGTQYNKGAVAGDEAGTWSWDGADDMKLNGYNGAGISAQGNLNIGVTGNNTITADAGQSAIAVKNGNLAITGDGTLNATAQNDVIAAEGDGNVGGDVTISGASVNVTASGTSDHVAGVRATAGSVKIDKGADVKIEAKSAEGSWRPMQSIFGIFADNIPNRHTAQEGEQEEPDSSYERGADVTIDDANLSIKTADAPWASACIYTVGIKKNTLMKIVNGADVVLSAGSAASFSAGIGARSQAGAVWMLVEKSNLTSRSLSAASSIDTARNQSFGIMAEANIGSETPRIQIFNSKIEASGATAGIYAINRNVANATLFHAAMIDLRGNATITTPTDGAVRDVKKVVDTGQWPSSQNGQVVGVAGSSAITDIVGSSEVAHDVVIDFGDGQEPEPTPEPDPTPNPDPMPNPEQKPDLKPVDKDVKTTTTVATKTATGAKNASGVLAATGDNAATAAAALGIAGASVIGAGFVASKRRNR